MQTLTTDYKINFTKAENDMFSWDSSWGEFLFHKASKRHIYQMRWKKTGESVEPEIKAAATEFWDALSILQKKEQERKWNATSWLDTEDGQRSEALERAMDDEDSIY
jgi:hypothetical protein